MRETRWKALSEPRALARPVPGQVWKQSNHWVFATSKLERTVRPVGLRLHLKIGCYVLENCGKIVGPTQVLLLLKRFAFALKGRMILLQPQSHRGKALGGCMYEYHEAVLLLTCMSAFRIGQLNHMRRGMLEPPGSDEHAEKIRAGIGFSPQCWSHNKTM